MNDGTQQDPNRADDREERDDALLSQLAGLRKALAQSVVVTGERVQETVEDAVRRGRMTRRDAQELASAILAASRRQTDEIRQELEALIDRGRRLGRRDEPTDSAVAAVPSTTGADAEVAASDAGASEAGASETGGSEAGEATASDTAADPATSAATTSDAAASSPQAPLPIRDYDDLTAVLVRKSLAGLSPEELRAVRDHEAAHANRKTVLQAVDRLLASA